MSATTHTPRAHRITKAEDDAVRRMRLDTKNAALSFEQMLDQARRNLRTASKRRIAAIMAEMREA